MTKQKHTARFKFTVVAETLKTGQVAEIARKYGVNANLVSNWRKQFLENGHQVFETSPDKESQNLRKELGKLEQIVGKKEIELTFLKNYLDFYTSPHGS